MSFSSAQSPSCSTSFLKSYPPVLVSNDLMDLIKSPPENKREGPISSPPFFAHLTTMEELLNHVKDYIVKNKLYDPKNPLEIVVGGSELGALLGKSQFSLVDVRNILLEKFVFPVSLAENSSEGICSVNENKSVPYKKRKLDKSDCSKDKVIYKKNKNISDDTSVFFESDESVHSFQDYETDFVKDSTSDGDNFSLNGFIIAETRTFDLDLEYEIENSSDNSCVAESESDLEDFVKTAIVNFIAESSDSDIEYLADRSSDDESEKELCEEDKWRCNCGILNDPVMRACCACWSIRSGWLPERSLKKENGEFKNNIERERKEFVCAKKGKKEKRHLKAKSNCFENKKDLSDLPSVTTESSASSSPPCKNVSVQSSSNTPNVENIKNEALCLLCCARPADCSIIHSKFGCRICCFTCGEKLFKNKKRCPTCRRKIERIVYLYHI